MRSTHATKIKFNKHMLRTLSFEFVKKKFVFKFASMENEFLRSGANVKTRKFIRWNK